MCGIIGVFSTANWGLHDDEFKTFYNLLVADSARGEDGTGVYWKDALDDKRWFFKQADPTHKAIGKQALYDMISDAKFVVGHNRAATLGSIDTEHTHPFNHGSVLGVHNGTVHGWDKLGLTDDALMDSDAIIKALGEADPDPEAVDEVLKKISTGAYALVWHDDRVDELRIVRNSQRPMFIVSTDRAVWFGSELRMVEWALYRNTEPPRTSFKLDTHTLLRIPSEGGAIVSPMTQTSVYQTTSTKGKAVANGNNYWTGYGGYTGNRFGLGEDNGDLPWYYYNEGGLL